MHPSIQSIKAINLLGSIWNLFSWFLHSHHFSGLMLYIEMRGVPLGHYQTRIQVYRFLHSSIYRTVSIIQLIIITFLFLNSSLSLHLPECEVVAHKKCASKEGLARCSGGGQPQQQPINPPIASPSQPNSINTNTSPNNNNNNNNKNNNQTATPTHPTTTRQLPGKEQVELLTCISTCIIPSFPFVYLPFLCSLWWKAANVERKLWFSNNKGTTNKPLSMYWNQLLSPSFYIFRMMRSIHTVLLNDIYLSL